MARGAYLSVALPFSAPLDEPFHYAYASFFASEGHPPRGAEPSVSGEEIRASAVLPRPSVWERGDASFEHFYRLPAAEQSRRRAEAFALAPSERTRWLFANYESQQPPLAYALAVPVLRVLGDITIDRRLLALRLFGTLIAAAAVPIVYALLRRFLPRPTALAATAAYIAFPGLGMFVGRFTNDQLALPLMAAVLLFLVDVAEFGLTARRAIALAALLAAGLWTKLYFLAMLPALPCVALLSPRSTRRRTLVFALGAALAAWIVFLPWMARQKAATGDGFGLTETIRARALGVTEADRLHTIRWLVNPERVAVFGRTFVWPGTWTWMGAPWPVFQLMAAGLMAVAVFARRPPSKSARRGLAALALALLWFLAAQAFHAATFAAVAGKTRTAPAAGHEGWYLLVLLPIFLLAGEVIGLTRRAAFVALAALGLLADVVLQFGVLPGCYLGIFRQTGGSMTEALRLAAHPGLTLPVLSACSLPGLHATGLAPFAVAWLASVAVGIALTSWPHGADSEDPCAPGGA